MWYWLIPYLVAYQSTDPGILKYGPECVFKVQVHANATVPALNDTTVPSSMHSNLTMYLVCRPMEFPYVECRIKSDIIDNYELSGNDDDRKTMRHEPPGDFGIGNSTFQIKFNVDGVSKIWFLNTKGSFRRGMIRAIVGNFNLGIRAYSLKNSPQEILEKSVLGICNTIFDIDEKALPKDKNSETTVDGFKFHYRYLGKDADDDGDDDGDGEDDFFVVEKRRKMNDCIRATPYLFGSEDDIDRRRQVTIQTNITSSTSRFNCGRRSFSSSTENIGTLTFSSATKTQKSSVGEFIHVSLEEIRAAKKKLSSNEVNSGVGHEPGIPWPEKNVSLNGED